MLVKTRDSKSGTAVVDGYEVHAFGNIDVPLVGPAYFLSQAVLDIDAYSVRKIHAKKILGNRSSHNRDDVEAYA